MRIIRRVEIKYFRSIYSVVLKQCGELNVLSGRNDVGKSNVLRALNLFFNGETDWQSSLDFQKDFSLSRLGQVRKESVKGKQFIQVAIEFERPDNFKGSLPERFTIKRNWYRDQSQYSQSDNLAALYKAEKCPSSLASAQMMLPKFLNRVHFEYVPAVKDRIFFNHILARLQNSLLGRNLDADNPILALSGQLAEHIEQQVTDLRSDFSRATKLDTSIEPPRELSGLFQAFRVSVPSGDSQIPLNLRGDGMQARYVPSVLHYIAKKSHLFFIWGFEEPENSLEFSAADSLADDLQFRYAKDAQIFITSHSPAMVSRQGAEVSCYRVWQPDSQTQIDYLKLPFAESGSGAQLQEEIGLLRIYQEIHDEYKEKISQLEALSGKVNALEKEIAEHKLPLVIVEGSTDVLILSAAWSKLYPHIAMPFLIRSADPLANVAGSSGGGASAVAKAIESIHPAEGRRVLGLFDYDQEGIKIFDALSKNFRSYVGSPYHKRHSNGFASAMTLAVADPERAQVGAQNLCIEFLFDDDTLAERDADGNGLQIVDQQINLVVAGKRLPIAQDKLDLFDFDELVGDLSAYRTIAGGKKTFAEGIVPQLAANKFESFRPLFGKICEELGVNA